MRYASLEAIQERQVTIDPATFPLPEPLLVTATSSISSSRHAPHEYVERGASPRATLVLAAMARATVLIDGRSFVTPDDGRANAGPVLRHRLGFGYRAFVEKIDFETIVAESSRASPFHSLAPRRRL